MILVRAIWGCFFFCLGTTQYDLEQTMARPIVQHDPFVVVWNIPTARCQEHFGITLPLRAYGIVENQDNAFQGQNMTIFYKNKFGLYPFISSDGKWHYGGIPQNVNLKDHLEKASKEITELLNPDFHGLAVVDWEEWRPIWRRNWGQMIVYKKASKQRVQERWPDLSDKKQSYLAEVQFEQAARALMEQTLELGKALRPQGLWGFYSFPDCFNNNWEKENYTGSCNPLEVQWNNKLMWLWQVSSALYPSIYLSPKLPAPFHQRYVHHRLREALRVAQFRLREPLPVIPYSRVSYRHSSKYLTELANQTAPVTKEVMREAELVFCPKPDGRELRGNIKYQDDLMNTMGESAALGAAGVVLWGDLSYSRSAESCQSLRNYIDTILGPYVVKVSTAACACSRQRCRGNGRCVRRRLDDFGSFLHLDLEEWTEMSKTTNVLDQKTLEWEAFQCHCYPGWTGPWCEKPWWMNPVKGPESNRVSQYYNIYDIERDGNTIAGSNVCPPKYEEKTEF